VTHGTDQKICSLCEYWTGARQVIWSNTGKERVDVQKLAMGECENSFSKFFEQGRRQDLRCQHFSKWTEVL